MDEAGRVSRLPYGMTGEEAVFERVPALASALFGKVYVSIVIASEGAIWRSIDPHGRLIAGTPFADPVTASGRATWWEDVTREPALASHPVVTGPPFIRFAAAAPIQLANGELQGALAVTGLDHRPLDPVRLANLERLAAMIADECDRARTAQQLRAQQAAARVTEQIHRVFSRAVPASVIMTDRELRVLQASERFLDTVPIAAKDAVGRQVADLTPQYFERFRPMLQRCLAGESIIEERLRLQTCSGAEAWVRAELTPWRDADGEVGGVISVTSDITDLLQAKEEAEAANQAKSVFLATMSHEIRTPLNGVLGMAQVMAADALAADQRDRLDVIRQSGEALLAILNDVLDLSKIEAGKLELEAIEFDIGDIARGAHAAFQGVAEGKGLAFDLTIEPGAQGRYLGDSTRLRQVLYNLVSNALKFTEKGRVDVRLARIGEDLTISVSDTGVGIPAHRLARLFDKFEQADASTTRRFGGTGLGLSICRELAQLMGGEIVAESEPGAGARFTVRLPLPYLGAPHSAAPADETSAETEDLPPLRLLAAEDNAVNRLVLSAMLQQAGLEPVLVADGAEAVERWRRESWDLILMDVQMPGMDGPTAARLIRAEEAASGRPRTPIIALTANAMSHQVAEYMQSGMDDFVAKPLDVALLFGAIERATGGVPELVCA